jgi:hypothetical protein
MTAPLSDLIVVEIAGDVATRYCGQLFAEHGAQGHCHVNFCWAAGIHGGYVVPITQLVEHMSSAVRC